MCPYSAILLETGTEYDEMLSHKVEEKLKMGERSLGQKLVETMMTIVSEKRDESCDEGTEEESSKQDEWCGEGKEVEYERRETEKRPILQKMTGAGMMQMPMSKKHEGKQYYYCWSTKHGYDDDHDDDGMKEGKIVVLGRALRNNTRSKNAATSYSMEL